MDIVTSAGVLAQAEFMQGFFKGINLLLVLGLFCSLTCLGSSSSVYALSLYGCVIWYWPSLFGASLAGGFYLFHNISFLCEKPLRELSLVFLSSFVPGAFLALFFMSYWILLSLLSHVKLNQTYFLGWLQSHHYGNLFPPVWWGKKIHYDEKLS